MLLEGAIGKCRSQKRLLKEVVAAAFAGLGTGAMFGGSTGCGRASEEVGTLNTMFGLRLLSMTFRMSVSINWVVCGVKIFFKTHCFDRLQNTCLNRACPVKDKKLDGLDSTS